ALRAVDTIIIDEIHALVPTKRGAHLAVSIERLAALCGRAPQRIGLSATQRPLDEVARFLGGVETPTADRGRRGRSASVRRSDQGPHKSATHDVQSEIGDEFSADRGAVRYRPITIIAAG